MSMCFPYGNDSANEERSTSGTLLTWEFDAMKRTQPAVAPDGRLQAKSAISAIARTRCFPNHNKVALVHTHAVLSAKVGFIGIVQRDTDSACYPLGAQQYHSLALGAGQRMDKDELSQTSQLTPCLSLCLFLTSEEDPFSVELQTATRSAEVVGR